MRRLLTIQAAADRLGISPKTCYEWVYERRLPVVRLGRCLRIPDVELEKLIEDATIPAVAV